MTAALYMSVGAVPPKAIRSATDLVVLQRIAWHSDESGTALLTWDELSREAFISSATLGRSLSRLEEAGLVSRPGTWNLGKSRGATRFLLSSALVSGAGVPQEAPSLNLKISKRETDVRTPSPSLSGLDPLSADGLRLILRRAQADAWRGHSVKVLQEAIIAEVSSRLGWMISRRTSMDRAQARDDLVSRMWEVLRTNTDKICGAENPWGFASRILQRQIDHADETVFQEVSSLIGDEETPVGEYEHGVTHVLIDDLLESYGSPHHQLVHRLVESGVPQGLAWNATRRMVEIAAAASQRDWITRARADAALLDMGLPPQVIGAWMSLIVGTRRGGADSSFLLRVSQGGRGITEDESRRFSVIADEMRRRRSER